MGATPPSLRLRAGQRMKQGRDFQRAKTQGRRSVNGCLILNWIEAAHGAAGRVGIITSRKIGGATVRSRARRLLREAFRLNQHRLARRVDIVLVARNSIVGKTFAEVENDFVAALKRAGLLKNESGTTSGQA